MQKLRDLLGFGGPDHSLRKGEEVRCLIPAIGLYYAGVGGYLTDFRDLPEDLICYFVELGQFLSPLKVGLSSPGSLTYVSEII